MIIAIGSDHAGFAYKEPIIEHLKKQGIEIIDEGPASSEPTDYPDYAFRVSRKVQRKEADLGILICGTGIGMSIAANKVRGIRAAVIQTDFTAEAAKTHNHANVITFGTRVNTIEEVLRFTDIFLKADESKAVRHQNRVDKIDNYKE